MEIWYGTDGEMDIEDELGSEPNALPEVPVASESDEKMGSASACASTLSRRERLINSSPEGWEATAEKRGERAVRDEARLGKRDDSMVLFMCLDDIGGGNRAEREKGGFRTSTARAATGTVGQAKRVKLPV